MRVDSAEFVAGAARGERIPPASLPEIAFAGRSNVGKSSLLNRIVGRRKLARVSKTPGRTQQINFFAINQRVMFVDLPGYGFAKVSHALREQWGELVEHYLTKRKILRAVMVIVDIRRGVEDDDQALLDFLAAHAVPARLIVTKIDKLPRGQRITRLRALARTIADGEPIPFSAETGEGVADVWREIEALAMPK